MSRTDKTDPDWVKLRRYGTPVHDHSKLDCKIAEPCQRSHWWGDGESPCYLRLYPGPWAMTNHWFERGGCVQDYMRAREGAARTETRVALRNLIKYGDYEDADVEPTRHRGSALWDAW